MMTINQSMNQQHHRLIPVEIDEDLRWSMRIFVCLERCATDKDCGENMVCLSEFCECAKQKYQRIAGPKCIMGEKRSHRFTNLYSSIDLSSFRCLRIATDRYIQTHSSYFTRHLFSTKSLWKSSDMSRRSRWELSMSMSIRMDGSIL